MNQSDGHGAGPDLSMALLSAAQRVEQRIEGALESHGLSLAKLNVLTMLVESDRPLSLGEIAGRLACVRSNVTQLVDRLEADGLVKRQDDENDRRSVLAVVTDTGRGRQAAGASTLASVQDEISHALASYDTEHLEQALRSL